MSKTKPYYYRGSKLSGGRLIFGELCPFHDTCTLECFGPKTTPVDKVETTCPEATRLNREFRSTPEPTPKVVDQRGRTWERFTDEANFGSICIRCLDVPDARDFNSHTNFSFFSRTDADAFWEMLPRLS